MRPRAPAAAADEADDLPLRHVLARLHVDLLHVAEERLDAVAVIDDHVPAVVASAARGDDGPRRRRRDRRAWSAADVDSLVQLRPAVPRGAAPSELGIHGPAERPAKREGAHELAGAVDRMLQLAEPRSFLGDGAREEIDLVLRPGLDAGGDGCRDGHALRGLPRRAPLGDRRLEDDAREDAGSPGPRP